MTRFALAAKCGCLTASGSAAEAPRAVSAVSNSRSTPGSTSEPPSSERRTCRRVQPCFTERISEPSIQVQELVAAEEDTGQAGPGFRLPLRRRNTGLAQLDRKLLPVFPGAHCFIR